MDCIYQACSCVMMDVPREIGFIFCLDLLQTRSTFKPRVKQTIKHYTLHYIHYNRTLVISLTPPRRPGVIKCYPGGYQLSRYHGITPHPAISAPCHCHRQSGPGWGRTPDKMVGGRLICCLLNMSDLGTEHVISEAAGGGCC